jgi:hypothetical protein
MFALISHISIWKQCHCLGLCKLSEKSVDILRHVRQVWSILLPTGCIASTVAAEYWQHHYTYDLLDLDGDNESVVPERSIALYTTHNYKHIAYVLCDVAISY